VENADGSLMLSRKLRSWEESTMLACTKSFRGPKLNPGLPRLMAGVLALLIVPLSLLGETVENPRLAVIMSRASFDQKWDVTQMSAHGWVGIANLAGIPYDTLFLEDLVAGEHLSRYRVLVFAECTSMEPDTVSLLTRVLASYLKQGGNLLIDGPLGAFTRDGKAQAAAALWSLLGISSSGVKGDTDFRIQVRDNHHYITRAFEPSQYLSQALAKGLEIQQFSSGGHVLVTSTNAHESFPFLSYRDTGTSRLVLISDATTFAGATSIFRNEAPQGFFPNEVVNVLIRALQWAAYGDVHGAFPAPQFSNANLAVIVRLDADNTQNLDYQKQTFKFLLDTARETGVVPLYCFVSSAGAKAGWKDLAELGQQLEDLGGQIGSHSKYHRIESRMGPEKYKEELDGSIEEIESNMTSNGARIGKVDLFINPGDTIVNSDYEEIARRFQLMMTHGFEQDTPIGSGVMTWFTGKYKDFVVLDDTPSPDYQWFYDPTWSYTTAQITSYQEAVFDHLFRDISHGYIYNQMWHDYSISSMPLRHGGGEQQAGAVAKPARIANTSNMAMYEALRSKFATHLIYTPEPMEVVEKLHAMAGWNYSWTGQGDVLEMVLDLSNLPRTTTASFVAGMGIRIENTAYHIESVTINGQPHDAFSDRVIILPNLKAGKNQVKVTLSEHGANRPHVVYVSSRMPSVRRTVNGIEFQLLTRSRGRFAVDSPAPGLVLHADAQEFNLRGDHVLSGFVSSDRTLQYVPFKRGGLSLNSVTVPVREVNEGTNTLTLILDKASSPRRQVIFSSARPPKHIRFNGQVIQAESLVPECLITLPEYKEPASLEILW
jgi:hypothetical protein